jgi:hypothetical protein
MAILVTIAELKAFSRFIWILQSFFYLIYPWFILSHFQYMRLESSNGSKRTKYASRHEHVCGRRGAIASPFFIKVLDGGEWSASRPGRFTHHKDPPVSTGQEAGWIPEPVWTLREVENVLASAGNRTPGIQPVAHRYTCWDRWVWRMKQKAYGLKRLETNCDISVCAWRNRRKSRNASGRTDAIPIESRNGCVRNIYQNRYHSWLCS